MASVVDRPTLPAGLVFARFDLRRWFTTFFFPFLALVFPLARARATACRREDLCNHSHTPALRFICEVNRHEPSSLICVFLVRLQYRQMRNQNADLTSQYRRAPPPATVPYADVAFCAVVRRGDGGILPQLWQHQPQQQQQQQQCQQLASDVDPKVRVWSFLGCATWRRPRATWDQRRDVCHYVGIAVAAPASLFACWNAAVTRRTVLNWLMLCLSIFLVFSAFLSSLLCIVLLSFSTGA